MVPFSTIVAVAAVLLCLTGALLPPMNDNLAFSAGALPTLSGYLPLNRSSSVVKMFYAYYEAIEPSGPISGTPIILWLQGGPGCSSMTGNFYELGPWRTAPDLQLHKNDAPWNNRFGVLFMDNPVGSGYSISERDEDIPINQDQVAEHLFAALRMFFRSQPSYQQRPFFIAGESYAGKYVPALGHYIMRLMDSTGFIPRSFPFRMDGLIIGNGLTDPKIQVQTHAETAYNFGLIDKQQKAHLEELAGEVVKLIEKEDWQAAYKSRTELMDWIQKATGLATVLDIRRNVPYHCMDDGTEFLGLFLNRKDVKAALKADDAAHWISCNPRVRRIMSNDTMKSVKWMVNELLVRFPILLYQGQYDIKDGVVSSEEWMRTLSWEWKDEFFDSERRIWRVGNLVAGYWRSLRTLTHVVILGAGHQVPADQSLSSQQMIEKWIGEQLGRARRPFAHLQVYSERMI